MLKEILQKIKLKAVLASCLGYLLAIGVDHQTGVPRMSYEIIELYDGIDFLVVIVGLFAVSEVFVFIENTNLSKLNKEKKIEIGSIIPKFKTIKKIVPAMFRGTFLGFLSGILPGAGASLGSFVAYTFEKKISNKNDTFGKGPTRIAAAPEAGNNAAAGGALVPMLALGVPGSGTTAVLLAMLMTLDVTPGPLLFKQNPDVVWGLIAALFIGNIVLLILNIPLCKIFFKNLINSIKVSHASISCRRISFVGIYGISGSSFDLIIMVMFGLLGWLLRKLDIPLVPIIMGVILGEHMESNLRRAMTIHDGDWFMLISSNVSIVIWSITFVGFILPFLFRKKIKLTINKLQK